MKPPIAAPRRPAFRFVLTLLLAALAYGGPRLSQSQSVPDQSAQVQWNGVDRIIAFADVHGAYSELLTLLREVGVVDERGRWAAGHTHVVSLGDLLDRGAESRKVMDLLMRLQGEAQAAGGRMHVLLGNHEAMNLLGDLRYVAAGEYRSYIDVESVAEREAARLEWQARPCSGACDGFEKQFPLGYFGHRAAFAPGAQYGRWLLQQPVGIKINDTLFMHAGIGATVRGMQLEELNLRYRTALTSFLGLAQQLAQAQLLLIGDDYGKLPELAKQRLAATGSAADASLGDVVTRFEQAANNPLLSEDGPNWYRGDALCREATESDVLQPLLQQFGAARMVVGHTPTRNSRVVTRFNGQVVKLDTGMNAEIYKGRAAALTITPSGLSVRYAGQPAVESPEPEGLFVTPNQFADSSVLAALRDGEISIVGPRGPDELDISVSRGSGSIKAVFQVRNANAARRELAAFALDRLLGLGIVPATVARPVQGQIGVVQARPQQWINQVNAEKQGVQINGWCSVAPQFQLMYTLDALVGNESRVPESILYDSSEGLVYTTDFRRAFGTKYGLPASLQARAPSPGNELRRRLGALSEARLAAALGENVDRRQRRAILARRDALLALPAATATVQTQ